MSDKKPGNIYRVLLIVIGVLFIVSITSFSQFNYRPTLPTIV